MLLLKLIIAKSFPKMLKNKVVGYLITRIKHDVIVKPCLRQERKKCGKKKAPRPKEKYEKSHKKRARSRLN